MNYEYWVEVDCGAYDVYLNVNITGIESESLKFLTSLLLQSQIEGFTVTCKPIR